MKNVVFAIYMVNCKGFENLFQYSAEEIRGRYINDVIIPEDLLDQATNLSNTVIGGRSVQMESVRRRKDGTLINVSILAVKELERCAGTQFDPQLVPVFVQVLENI